MQTVPIIFFSGNDALLRERVAGDASHTAAFVRKLDVDQLRVLVQRLLHE